MRDFNVPTMTFVDVNGNSVILKEMREYPTDMTLRSNREILSQDTLDLIAVKEYGDGQEADCYKIYDYNREGIVDNGFSLSGVKKLGIPN